MNNVVYNVKCIDAFDFSDLLFNSIVIPPINHWSLKTWEGIDTGIVDLEKFFENPIGYQGISVDKYRQVSKNDLNQFLEDWVYGKPSSVNTLDVLGYFLADAGILPEGFYLIQFSD